MDTDRNGFIDYSEFLAAALPRKIYLREDYLRTAFDMFDTDLSGKIDMVELAEILQAGGEYKCSKQELAAYIKKIDLNGDGMIDFVEFKKMMESRSN